MICKQFTTAMLAVIYTRLHLPCRECRIGLCEKMRALAKNVLFVSSSGRAKGNLFLFYDRSFSWEQWKNNKTKQNKTKQNKKQQQQEQQKTKTKTKTLRHLYHTRPWIPRRYPDMSSFPIKIHIINKILSRSSNNKPCISWCGFYVCKNTFWHLRRHTRHS